MRQHIQSLFLLLALLFPSLSGQAQTAAPPFLNFQGRLAKSDGTPVADGNYNIQFALYNTPTGGTLWWQQSMSNVPVRNGVIAARLDFSNGYQNGATRSSLFGAAALYLATSINGGDPLTPRQQFAPVAYAFKADTALTVPDGSITGAKIASGTITSDKFASHTLNPLAWLRNGNSGVTSGFLGTTDNNPLAFKTNNRRVMRYQYAEDALSRSINILGGSEINEIGAGVIGATLAGGGQDNINSADWPNRVTANFGTVGGGFANTAGGHSSHIGGGRFNTTSGDGSGIGGGSDNMVSGGGSTISGGRNNIASGGRASIGGGGFNSASGGGAVIGGGDRNAASGFYSTVPGGNFNVAAGDYSFAAGNRAKASHNGSFVWADSQNGDFGSYANDQFNVRAQGGVNFFGTTNVWAPLGCDTLYVYNMPYGDRRNVQWDDVTKQFYYDNSSRRHKENIQPLRDDFLKLLQVEAKTYTRPNAPGRWEIGYIAEEFHEAGLKRLVDYEQDGVTPAGINYEKICLYLAEIAKHQQKEVETLKKDVGALRQENVTLQATLSSVLKRLEILENTMHK